LLVIVIFVVGFPLKKINTWEKGKGERERETKKGREIEHTSFSSP